MLVLITRLTILAYDLKLQMKRALYDKEFGHEHGSYLIFFTPLANIVPRLKIWACFVGTDMRSNSSAKAPSLISLLGMFINFLQAQAGNQQLASFYLYLFCFLLMQVELTCKKLRYQREIRSRKFKYCKGPRIIIYLWRVICNRSRRYARSDLACKICCKHEDMNKEVSSKLI